MREWTSTKYTEPGTLRFVLLNTFYAFNVCRLYVNYIAHLTV
jgi:hypothetical protein